MPKGIGETFIHMEKEHLAAMMEAGYIYLGMRRYKQAKELFEGLVAIAPESDVALVALGNAEFCQGNVATAIVQYKKALKLDPDSHFAKVYLGEALLFSGKDKEALELLNEVANADKGAAGNFAVSLLSAIDGGFKPTKKKH